MRVAVAFADGATVEDATLGRFANALSSTPHAAHVAGMSAGVTKPSLLERATDGSGWTLGRYAGQLELDGRLIVIEPRMGWDRLGGWVTAATGLPVPVAARSDAGGRVSALASMLWVRAVDGASRHGPPAFRRDVPYEGGSVRGRIDVRRTVRLRAKGASSAASVYRARELDNPVTRIIVAADRVLMRQVGQGRWRTDRVDDVLGQLQTAVGRRTPAPGERELHRMRYTPITRPFKWAAELSSRIVLQDPVATTVMSDRVQGLVLDLDNVYGAATLNWCRDARPDLRAETVTAGLIVMRDRHEVRATLDVLPCANGSGAPVLAVSRTGAVPHALELPEDAAEAATAVDRELAAL